MHPDYRAYELLPWQRDQVHLAGRNEGRHDRRFAKGAMVYRSRNPEFEQVTISPRKMATRLAFFFFFICIHFAISADISWQSMSNISQQSHVTLGKLSTNFIATIVSICQDPIEGYILKCQSGTSTVLIWEDDVRDLTIGAKYRILCTYVGVHPSGKVNVYVSIVWEAVNHEGD